MMERTESIAALAAALAAFGADVTNPPQNRTATVPTKAGGQYQYTYADLGDVLTHVRPALAKHGLAVTQEVITSPDSVEVMTTLLHKSGEYLAFAPLVLPAGGTPQNFGGVITYARRYSVLAALGIASEADDAAHAAPQEQPRATGGKPATEKQLGKIHAIAKEAGVTDEQLHKGAKRDYGVDSLKSLSTKQASEMIDKLGKLPVAPPPEPEPEEAAPPADDDADYWPSGDEPAEEIPGMDAGQARQKWGAGKDGTP